MEYYCRTDFLGLLHVINGDEIQHVQYEVTVVEYPCLYGAPLIYFILPGVNNTYNIVWYLRCSGCQKMGNGSENAEPKKYGCSLLRPAPSNIPTT